MSELHEVIARMAGHRLKPEAAHVLASRWTDLEHVPIRIAAEAVMYRLQDPGIRGFFADGAPAQAQAPASNPGQPAAPAPEGQEQDQNQANQAFAAAYLAAKERARNADFTAGEWQPPAIPRPSGGGTEFFQGFIEERRALAAKPKWEV